MTKAAHSTTIRCLFFAALLLAAISCAPKRPSIVEQLAKSYGLDSFGQIDAIRYTFHAQFPGVNVEHAWTWEPKTGKVSFQGMDQNGNPVKIEYVRSQLASQPANVKDTIEPSFVNDNYWLLFPLHAYWDSSANIQETSDQKLPLGDGSATLMTVKYPSEAGGYTPGDTWDLYIGPDKRIQQFIYHRGGPKKPSLVVATWEGYKMAGPLLISTDHRGAADGQPLQLTFSDVAVKLSGSDAWLNAQ